MISSLKVYCKSGKRLPPESWVVQEFEAINPKSTSARVIYGFVKYFADPEYIQSSVDDPEIRVQGADLEV
jgi:hypothetical protein